METFLANAASYDPASVRTETLNGRSYRVVPLTLIVPGVLNGSDGPLLYPEQEVRQSVNAWNGMPIVNGHPTDREGRPVSARSPEIAAEYQVGFVYRAVYDGKLVSEGWFDEELTRTKTPWLYQNILNRRPSELSTGLYLVQDPARGTYNGKSYTAVAKNYRPDHLAVLKDETGACSLRDGCGVLVNKSLCSCPDPSKCGCVVNEDDDMEYPGDCPHCGMKHNAKPAKAVCNGCGKAMKKSKPHSSNSEPSVNKTQLVAWLTTNCECWKGAEATLNGMDEAQLTKLKAGAEKAAADLQSVNNKLKDAEGVVNAITTTGFKDGNVQYVYNAATKQFVKTNLNPDLDPKPVPKPQTTEEWFASAPPDVQEAVRNAAEIVTNERASLVAKLIGNVSDAEKAELTAAYAKVGLPTLRKMVNALPKPATPEPTKQTMPSLFIGNAGGGTGGGGDKSAEGESLPLPTVNYEEFCAPGIAAYLKNR